MRSSNPCDGCSLRRVRCSGGQQCEECKYRSVNCTFLRTRKKRGPKGPRERTSHRIETFQEQLKSGREFAQPLKDYSTPKQLVSPCVSDHCSIIGCHQQISIKTYEQLLQIYSERLYSVWPVVSHRQLLSSLRDNDSDYESYALASALCAAVIAQLRLHNHSDLPFAIPSPDIFAAAAHRFRQQYDYYEQCTIKSVLTGFFLHIHYANIDKLRTAGQYLRESLTFAHLLKLHQPESYADVEPVTRQIMLRTYWLLFVSERTYCIQNAIPATLKPICILPSIDSVTGDDVAFLPAFLSLIRLFTCIDGQFLEAIVPSTDLACVETSPHQISNLQNNLSQSHGDDGLNESQIVDIVATRSWIRILLWQYTIHHFAVSCHTENKAFSAYFPASVAHDMLSLVARVSKCSVEPHGYGIELKVFRIADSLVDVLKCTLEATGNHNLLNRSMDSVHSLENLLERVGGAKSKFLSNLRQSMAELAIPYPPSPWRPLIEAGCSVEIEEDVDDILEYFV